MESVLVVVVVVVFAVATVVVVVVVVVAAVVNHNFIIKVANKTDREKIETRKQVSLRRK